jgi:hypothetical protein
MPRPLRAGAQRAPASPVCSVAQGLGGGSRSVLPKTGMSSRAEAAPPLVLLHGELLGPPLQDLTLAAPSGDREQFARPHGRYRLSNNPFCAIISASQSLRAWRRRRLQRGIGQAVNSDLGSVPLREELERREPMRPPRDRVSGVRAREGREWHPRISRLEARRAPSQRAGEDEPQLEGSWRSARRRQISASSSKTGVSISEPDEESRWPVSVRRRHRNRSHRRSALSPRVLRCHMAASGKPGQS